MRKLASVFTTILLCAATMLAQPSRPSPPSQPSGPPRPSSTDQWVYGPSGPGNWDQSWNRRPDPRRGACFYSDFNFQGNRFCVQAGDQLTRLPGGMGDHISSVRLFGGAQAVVFNDANFSNGSTRIRNSVPDLRTIPFRDGHTWNDRMSSVQVR